MKIHQHNAGHMAKMAAMSIYGLSTFKNLLSRSHLADVDETLYEAKSFIICANYDSGLTLTYFTARSNFAT